jgi:uncharacterized protein YggU (UPF0235/DUF167 family)
LHVRVRAAPADGAANEAVGRTIAAALRIAPSRVSLKSGAASRSKRIAVDGVDAGAIAARWPGLLTRKE